MVDELLCIYDKFNVWKNKKLTFSSRPMVLLKFWAHIYSYNFKSWMKRSRLRICLRVMVNKLLAFCVKTNKKMYRQILKMLFSLSQIDLSKFKNKFYLFNFWSLRIKCGLRIWLNTSGYEKMTFCRFFCWRTILFYTKRQLLINHRS